MTLMSTTSALPTPELDVYNLETDDKLEISA